MEGEREREREGGRQGERERERQGEQLLLQYYYLYKLNRYLWRILKHWLRKV